MGTANGIDVSSYQGPQDWTALAKGGLTFVFIKASEGQHTRDAGFVRHVKGALAADFVTGAYHFAWPNQPAATEAANYIGAVRAYAGRGFVHALDLERRTDGSNYSGMSATGIRAYATAWINAVKQAFPGQRVGVYTSASDVAAGHYPANSDFLWYPAYPAGAMTYAQAAGRAKPAPSGRAPVFWQFTSTPIDRSIAYMTPAALRAWAAGTIPTKQEEDDMPTADEIAQAVWTYQIDNPRQEGTQYEDAKALVWWAGADAAQANSMIKAQSAAITALAAAVGSGDDVATIVAAVQEAIKEAVVKVDVSVGDNTPAKG